MALTFGDFTSMKPRNQAAIVLTVVILGLALFWYAVLLPVTQENVTKQTTLDGITQQIQVASRRAEQLAQIREDTEALEVRLGELTDILPLERETAAILESVRLAAEDVGMEIVSFVPQGAIEREVYSEWPWSFQVRSTYHNMALFLDRIRTIPRIVNVSGVSMNAQGDGVTSSVGANFTATTFVYRDDNDLLEEAAN
jgi:type IV pilus assembly protein PilO